MLYFKERPTLCTVPNNHEEKDSDIEYNSTDEDNGASLASPDFNIAQKSPLPEQTIVCETTVMQYFTSKKKRLISESSQNCTPVLKKTELR